MTKFENALISVSDKTGLIEFIRPLYDAGLRLVSTGGTAKALREAGMAVIEVSEQTGFPEVMDGRVKTLHPRIHMPLLAREGHREDERLLESHDLAPFDLLIVNLYPFENALKGNRGEADLIENIDIGGPSLLRGAAKNFERLTVVVDPADYGWISGKAEVTREDRKYLAAKTFAHVSSYDAMIAETLAPQTAFEQFALGGTLVKELRYGENPHQSARWYQRRGAREGWHNARVLQGKELSYNNLLDLESALDLIRPMSQAAAVAVKHNNPCGVAVGVNFEATLKKCLAADPVSVFGGIVAVNREITLATAEALKDVFLECIVAAGFTRDALDVLSKKKNLRLLDVTDVHARDPGWRVQTLAGGFLVQSPDEIKPWDSGWNVIGQEPSPEVRGDLSLAWTVAAHLKSNAIAICGGGQTLGLGMGQVNRVDAVEQAIARLQRFHPDAPTPVLASDAFFPFADSIELIHAAGIRWVIQPGGSVKDAEVLKRAADLGVNLVLTGRRHFRH